MGTKANPGKFDCYNNALADEPMFVLIGRDPSAPTLIEAWASERLSAIDRGERPESDRTMVAEARDCANAMREWRRTHDGEWRTAERRPPKDR